MMLKFLSVFIFTFIAASCSSTVSQNKAISKQEPILAEVATALALALQQQDYRLLVPSTRGINVPGLELAEFKPAIALCGKKYMANTSDVLASEQDRNIRKKAFVYMQQYNQKMWLMCQSNMTTTH